MFVRTKIGRFFAQTWLQLLSENSSFFRFRNVDHRLNDRALSHLLRVRPTVSRSPAAYDTNPRAVSLTDISRVRSIPLPSLLNTDCFWARIDRLWTNLAQNQIRRTFGSKFDKLRPNLPYFGRWTELARDFLVEVSQSCALKALRAAIHRRPPKPSGPSNYNAPVVFCVVQLRLWHRKDAVPAKLTSQYRTVHRYDALIR